MESTLESAAELAAERAIAGFVHDPAAPEKRFVVELWLDGQPTRLARANLFDADLSRQGKGDGCYRFVFALNGEASAEIAEIRLANTGALIGRPIALASAPIQPERRIGEARWAGGLRITG